MHAVTRPLHDVRRGWLLPFTVLSAALAVVMALVVPASPALADHGEPRGTDNVCPPPGQDSVESDFDDTEGHSHEGNIECLADYGIAQGYEDGTYRPDVAINRAQMATFIRNFVETAIGQEMPQPETPRFTDTQGNEHQGNIAAVAEAGIVQGYPERRYRPGQNVNRAQMATFIANSVDYVDDREVNRSEPPETEQSFFEDTGDTEHHGNINRLAAQHIVVGTGDDNYNPGRLVRRGAMATFIMQAADYLAAQEMWLVQPSEMTLEPREAENPANLRHRLTATVTDELGFTSPGVDVRFEVYRERLSSEQGTGTVELVADGNETTDGSGEAYFSYNAEAAEGDSDRIIACVLEEADQPAEGEEFCAERQPGAENTLLGITPREDRITARADKNWTAEEEPTQAESGGYFGEVIGIDAGANALDVQTDDGDFLRFSYDGETDTFHVNPPQHADASEAQFECAVQATLDEDADHRIGIDYDTEGESEFGLFTEAEVGRCFDGGGGE